MTDVITEMFELENVQVCRKGCAKKKYTTLSKIMLCNTDTTLQCKDTALSMMPCHSQRFSEEVSFLREDESVKLRGRCRGG